MDKPSDEKDLPPENGEQPPYAERPVPPPPGKVGTGSDYSGEEYDSAGQAEWRERDRKNSVPRDGTVTGSGVGAGGGSAREDYDPASSFGAHEGRGGSD